MEETTNQKTHHKALCELAVKWLKRARSAGGPGCAVALTECKTGWSGEIPDAIGFRFTGHEPTDGSVLVEVKVSRADFLADAKKPHRVSGGIGSWRYYMAPVGLIDPCELPQGWGLLQVNSRGHIKALAGHAVYFRGRYDEYKRQACLWRWQQVDLLREQYLLVRVLANTGDPQKVLDMLRDTNNRANRLTAAVSKVAVALGLSEYTPSSEVARHARILAQRLARVEHNNSMEVQ